nr:DUF302 domain-containing protein [uncultured Actinoplanes sp.]
MSGDGLASIRSDRPVAETTAAIRAEAERRGATVAAVVDHAAAARGAGLAMPDTQVVIFGNPRAGTPAMLAAPDIAIDLPLRIMVRDDGGPGSLITWQDPAFVAARYGLAGDQAAFLNVPAAIAQAVTAH